MSLIETLGDVAEELLASSNFVTLGDGERDESEISGLLMEIQESGKFEGKKNYKLLTAEGEEKILCGSAAIECKIGAHLIGRVLRLSFRGWEKTEKGQRFKDIRVEAGRNSYSREEFLEKLGLDGEQGGLGF